MRFGGFIIFEKMAVQVAVGAGSLVVFRVVSNALREFSASARSSENVETGLIYGAAGLILVSMGVCGLGI
jgi:hypothetical protein